MGYSFDGYVTAKRVGGRRGHPSKHSRGSKGTLREVPEAVHILLPTPLHPPAKAQVVARGVSIMAAAPVVAVDLTSDDDPLQAAERLDEPQQEDVAELERQLHLLDEELLDVSACTLVARLNCQHASCLVQQSNLYVLYTRWRRALRPCAAARWSCRSRGRICRAASQQRGVHPGRTGRSQVLPGMPSCRRP